MEGVFSEPYRVAMGARTFLSEKAVGQFALVRIFPFDFQACTGSFNTSWLKLLHDGFSKRLSV